jgi:hypothetical protein
MVPLSPPAVAEAELPEMLKIKADAEINTTVATMLESLRLLGIFLLPV